MTNSKGRFPAGIKNYMTPSGFESLQNELRQLVKGERPKLVETVRWAAGNGDRSENGDYIYGKKRLREIDRRIRYLTLRIENAQVVDPKLQQGMQQVFFGALVRYQKEGDDKEVTVKIVGVDEADLSQGKISVMSPLVTALLKKSVGDVIEFDTPSGAMVIEILSVKYVTD